MANCVPCRDAGRGAVLAHYNADPSSGKPAMCWHCRNTPKLPHPMDPARRKEEQEVEEEMRTAKQNTNHDIIPNPTHTYCACKVGCTSLARPGKSYAWGHKPKKNATAASPAPAPARPESLRVASPASNGNGSTEIVLDGKLKGMTIQRMTRDQYQENFGAATAWVSDEVRKVMDELAGAEAGDCVVVTPPVKSGETKAEAIKNLRDRLYRGFSQKKKELKYTVKCSQVVRAGHVLVEKL